MFIEIRNPGHKLRISNGLLEIQEPQSSSDSAEPRRMFRIPPKDLKGLVIETPQTLISAAVIVRLTEAGVPIVLCDEGHKPTAEVSSAWGAQGAERAKLLRAQVLLRADTKARLWKQIVRQKLKLQSATLDLLAAGDGAARLRRLAEEVRPGDPENREATGAQIYWRALMGRSFLRRDTEDNTNALLNYGYAVLRSALLRRLHESGLHPAFGIHHANDENPGNLADDLLEPFRPAVDRLVHLLRQRDDDTQLTPALKSCLAELPNYPVNVGGQWMLLTNAMLETTRSHAAILSGERNRHTLPEQLEEPKKCPTPGDPCG